MGKAVIKWTKRFARPDGQLQSGLSKSTEGLEKVSNGLGDAQKYLGELNESKALRNSIFQKKY